MIKTEKFVVGPLASNAYLLYDDESKKCLIIDLGGDFSKIEARAEALGLDVKALLLTHGHFDHTLDAFRADMAGIPVFISEKDAFMLDSGENSLADTFGVDFIPVKRYKTLKEGEYDFGGFNVKVIETPGHTIGSVCYLVGDKLFSGDTLFKGSYGRYDLPTGSFNQLIASFKKLSDYSDLTVYCGHEDQTLINDEKVYNPLFQYASKRS